MWRSADIRATNLPGHRARAFSCAKCSALPHRAGAYIAHHRANDHKHSHRDRRPDASPEPDPAERDEKRAVLACEVEPELVGQHRAHRGGDQKAPGPCDGDTKSKLQGLLHQVKRHGRAIPLLIFPPAHLRFDARGSGGATGAKLYLYPAERYNRESTPT